MNVDNDYHIKEIVYLIHDMDQKPRMITAIIIQEFSIMYEVICEHQVSNHYAFELSKEKKVF